MNAYIQNTKSCENAITKSTFTCANVSAVTLQFRANHYNMSKQISAFGHHSYMA